MYYIHEFNDGRSVIFMQAKNQLLKYNLHNGRIYSGGVLLKDINRHFSLWDTVPCYISYESVDGSSVICELTSNSTTEKFSLKNFVFPCCMNHKLFAFYLLPEKDFYKLCAVSADDFQTSAEICSNIERSETLRVYVMCDKFAIFFNNRILIIGSDFKIIHDISISGASDPACKNQDCQSCVKNSEQKQLLQISQLSDEISRLKYSLHEMEQKHSDFIREYQDLYAYTGRLQEKLRFMKLQK